MRIAMRPSLPVLAGMLLFALGALGMPSFAEPPDAQGFVPHGPAAMPGAADQEKLIASIEKRYNARVVKVAETSVNGRPALRLRLLSSQRVWSVTVDAATGQVLDGA
jgi:hypothetical protein